MQKQNRLLNFYFLYVLYIVVVHRSKHWWFVNNPPVSSRGQVSTVADQGSEGEYQFERLERRNFSNLTG